MFNNTFQNPYQRVRMKSMLAPDPPTPTFNTPIVNTKSGVSEDTTPETDDDQFYKELMRMRQKEGPAMSAYKTTLAAVPQQDDYRPSVMTRIAAGLGGFSEGLRDPARGIQTAMETNRSPYMNAMQDWTTKAKSQSEGAKIESDESAGDMKDLMDAWGMKQKYRDYILNREKIHGEMGINQGKLAVEQRNADTAAARADAYIKAQNDPNFEFLNQTDGSVLKVDKKGIRPNEVIPAHNVAAFLAQSGRISANAAATQATAATRNAETNANRAATYGKYVEKMPGTRPQSATDQTRGMDLALREMAMDPAWKKFVKMDPTSGLYDPKDPGDFYPEEWQLFQDELKDRMHTINQGGR